MSSQESELRAEVGGENTCDVSVRASYGCGMSSPRERSANDQTGKTGGKG